MLSLKGTLRYNLFADGRTICNTSQAGYDMRNESDIPTKTPRPIDSPDVIACPVCRHEIDLKSDLDERGECSECETSFVPSRVYAQKDQRPAPISLEGQSLAGYIIHDKLGAGGMGVVYRATHTLLGHEAALKVLSSLHGERPSIQKAFAEGS